MTKKSMKDEYEDDFDYLDESDEFISNDALNDIIETSNHQTMMAIELTKIAVSKMTDSNMTEDRIFEIFKKASNAILESSPLRSLLEKN